MFSFPLEVEMLFCYVANNYLKQEKNTHPHPVSEAMTGRQTNQSQNDSILWDSEELRKMTVKPSAVISHLDTNGEGACQRLRTPTQLNGARGIVTMSLELWILFFLSLSLHLSG